jgi:SAM-dependent methyltransferase
MVIDRMPGLYADITAPYTAVEAWTYDRFIAPAVAELLERSLGDILDGIVEGAQVLDVGCGGGHALELLAARRPDLRLHGVDLSPGQIERARARLGTRATIVEGSALKLPYPSNRFDCVFSDASIKHWPDPARGLGECVRVLRPGGRLIVSEADRGCRFEDAAAFVRLWRFPRPLFLLNLALFRTWVAGQAFDLAEFEALAAALPLDRRRVRRVEGTPGIVLEGIKRLKRPSAGRGAARRAIHRQASAGRRGRQLSKAGSSEKSRSGARRK